jgi:type I restriction enzyme M protein
MARAKRFFPRSLPAKVASTIPPSAPAACLCSRKNSSNPTTSWIDRVPRELTDTDPEKITSPYHAWRGDDVAPRRGDAEKAKDPNLRASAPQREYSDVAGLCKSATTAEIAAHGRVLTPGRYVGAEAVAADGDLFEAKMLRLVAELHAQFAESAKLEPAIRINLEALGYEF